MHDKFSILGTGNNKGKQDVIYKSVLIKNDWPTLASKGTNSWCLGTYVK
jgi:hypothetical protein